jgi:hypothetical protein
MRKNRVVIFGSVLAPVAFVLGGSMLVDKVDSDGWRFFNTGKDTTVVLRKLAVGLKKRDLATVESLYSPGFRGKRLGLTDLMEKENKDGIRRLIFRSSGDTPTRDAAISEWRSYLDSLETVEEAGLYVHRMEGWDKNGDTVVSTRFEVIAKPKGAVYSGIDRAYFRMRFTGSGVAMRLVEASLIEGDRIIGDAPHFEDVAKTAGIDFKNEYYPEFLSQKLKFAMIRYGPAGISAADFDNDGFEDLFIPDGRESRLFRNNGDGTFSDVTAKAGLTGLDGVSVGLFADYDNDGHKDFFVSRTFKPNQLFHNNGDGTFKDVTKDSGIGADCCTTVASWADYDNDGDLDLYVGRYLDPRLDIPTTFYARNGEPNQLYRNDGNGKFTNVTVQAGVGETGLCLGTVFGDYDDDGYVDLYVVNDFGRKTLYHNNRDGTFTDVTVKTGTLAYGAGMNASISDYDNDEKLDLYVTHIRSEEAWYAEWPTVARYMINCMRQGVWKTDMPLYMEVMKQSGTDFVGVFQAMASGNTLLRNKGDGTFEDTTWKANANPLGWFWGAYLGDYDNDGWKDIYAANGWVYNDRDTEIELDFLNNVVRRQQVYKTGRYFDPAHFGSTSWHGWERDRHLRNNGDGTFTEIGRAAGNDLILNSRGVAAADYWNRGVLDLAVSASTDRHALLKNSVGTKRNWLEFELVGTKSNRDAVGARVTVRVKGKAQMREVFLGDGYGSQNTLRQHFGLNDATQADEVIVKWPRTGIVQKFQNVAANRILQVTEGKDGLSEKVYKAGK